MYRINFKDKYRIVHINNELGRHIIGGAGTYMNEIYINRRDDTGFVYVNMGDEYKDYDAKDFPDDKDILIMHKNESYKLATLDYDVLVIQFYEFAYLLTDEIIKNKKVVYVVHSIPTPEPPPKRNPFGGNDDIRFKFEKVCSKADLIICVSNAEKDKLKEMYPEYKNKIKVVYNGITLDDSCVLNINYKHSRRNMGYIGRMDYRKGILECVKELKNTEANLMLACPNNDIRYLNRILEYIKAADMEDRVTFYGWCVGERKENFLNSLDALIIPSLYEPFGYVALEAMKKGLLVISSNNGGLDEILSGYKYKYSPYEEGALERVVNEFINDDESVLATQQSILLNNLKKFTVENMINDYNSIWDELISKIDKERGDN